MCSINYSISKRWYYPVSIHILSAIDGSDLSQSIPFLFTLRNGISISLGFVNPLTSPQSYYSIHWFSSLILRLWSSQKSPKSCICLHVYLYLVICPYTNTMIHSDIYTYTSIHQPHTPTIFIMLWRRNVVTGNDELCPLLGQFSSDFPYFISFRAIHECKRERQKDLDWGRKVPAIYCLRQWNGVL